MLILNRRTATTRKFDSMVTIIIQSVTDVHTSRDDTASAGFDTLVIISNDDGATVTVFSCY